MEKDSTDSLEDLPLTDKLKILDFYRECVRREHSDILRLYKLGKLLLNSVTNEKTKTKLNEIMKKLDTIYSDLKEVV